MVGRDMIINRYYGSLLAGSGGDKHMTGKKKTWNMVEARIYLHKDRSQTKND